MNKAAEIIILGIESSCDDTSISVIKNLEVLSNVTANQKVHEKYGGVVPELASRSHQENIVPVYEEALNQANISIDDITAIAYTNGPGLLGSLLVGTSFAKSLALSTNKPLIAVNHMEAHVLAHFAKNNPDGNPPFPFVCLTVSGGHTQLLKVSSPSDYEILGETIDDAIGEAFDKCAKTLGLGYPGGPKVDKHAKTGNTQAYSFPFPKIDGLDFSFSGLKTSLLYFLEKECKKDEDFVIKNLDDICASFQHTLIEFTLKKVKKAMQDQDCKHIAVSGGVSANSYLREKLYALSESENWNCYFPPFSLCTDNGAMIAISGHFKYLNQDFSKLNHVPQSRWKPGTEYAKK